MQKIEILGVYPILAPVPCHLIEIVLAKPDGELDFRAFTQEIPGQPRANWQVAWDERILSRTPDRIHAVFFLHYLDFERPLLTPFGPVRIPVPSALPTYLDDIQYEPPC
jgi:hypothetical protein